MEPRNNPTHIWSTDFWQESQKHMMGKLLSSIDGAGNLDKHIQENENVYAKVKPIVYAILLWAQKCLTTSLATMWP